MKSVLLTLRYFTPFLFTQHTLKTHVHPHDSDTTSQNMVFWILLFVLNNVLLFCYAWKHFLKTFQWLHDVLQHVIITHQLYSAGDILFPNICWFRYIGSFILMRFTSANSTNCRLKIFGENVFIWNMYRWHFSLSSSHKQCGIVTTDTMFVLC